MGELIFIKDSIVQLYTEKAIHNKKGNVHYREELIETLFSLIIVKTKIEDPKQFWFITINFDLSAKEVAQA
jgi:hypothetical protein